MVVFMGDWGERGQARKRFHLGQFINEMGENLWGGHITATSAAGLSSHARQSRESSRGSTDGHPEQRTARARMSLHNKRVHGNMTPWIWKLRTA